MTVDVYLPRNEATVRTIDAGSGIVGVIEGDRLLIDYEGNRYGAANIVTFADRVHHAADRQAVRYPTVARSHVDPAGFDRIGSYDPDTGIVDLDDGAIDEAQARARLAAWCGISETDLDAQLATCGSARHVMTREVRAAMASHDPGRRFMAERMAQRHGITP